MGYETHNSVQNLGSFSFFILLYLIMLIILLLIKIFVWKTGKGISVYKFLKKNLIFGSLISLLVEPYIEILISSYLNIIAPVNIKNGDQVGIYTGYVGGIVSCGILPISLLWVISRNKQRLEDPSFVEKWGSFYSETKSSTFASLFFNFISLMRRLIFVILVFCFEVCTFQIIGLFVTNAIVAFYLV